MQWHEIQREFAFALRNPTQNVPGTIAKTNAAPSTRRFNVYRNNVAVSLVEAMADSYPVVKQLVGDEFFTAMAQAYVSDNAPRSAVMLDYGEGFPGFIATFTPAQGLPFLADVAKVEWAWNSAYNAMDCDPLSIDSLQVIPPEQLETIRFRLHPSFHLIASDWPAVTIWHIHQSSEDPAAAMHKLTPEAEHAIIVRPAWDVDVRLISEPTETFFGALAKRQTLGEAAETLAQADTAEMGNMLQLLFASGSVISLDATELT